MDFAVDLETLGRHTGCVILSIGVVGFDKNGSGLGPEFYQELQVQPQLDDGFHIESATLRWWCSQEDRSILTELSAEKLRPDRACSAFVNFVREHGDDESRVWAIGTDFDVAMLRWWCHRYKQDWPFWYGGARDVRTLCDVLQFDRDNFHVEGRPHHALDDAKYAALLVQAAYKHGKRTMRC